MLAIERGSRASLVFDDLRQRRDLASKHRKIFAFASVAGAALIAGLFAYYGSLVYQARGYEGFVRFSNVTISIAIVPAVNGLVWGWRSARSKRQK